MTPTARRLAAAGTLLLLAVAPFANGQPAYKLGVGAHLSPSAALTLEGAALGRSAVKDDPGFRLQYLVLKDGKEVAALDARANPTLPVPQKEAGTYTVVLQAFYPAYKGGKGQ